MSEEKPKLKIMIMVPHYWGKADNIQDAWLQVKQTSYKNLRDLKRGPWRVFAVYDTENVKTHVDEMGSICYPRDHHYVKIDENKNPK